jgi:hypothetical protein
VTASPTVAELTALLHLQYAGARPLPAIEGCVRRAFIAVRDSRGADVAQVARREVAEQVGRRAAA